MVFLEIHAERLEKALRAAPLEMRKELASVMLRAGVLHENIIKRRQFSGYRGESYANRLQRRSGALANAYRLSRPTASRLEMTAGIRSGIRGSEYARIQEFGGTVRPKRGKFLTVPLPRALTPSGVLSGRYKIRKSGTGYTTDAGPTFIFKGKSGKLLVGIKTGKRDTPTAFYVLKRSVTIKPRFGFFRSWDAIEKARIPRWLDQAAERAMGRSGR